jgi:hydroxyacylglutathione hydrolase
MNLIAPPAFTDNYLWMLHDGTHAVVVDPGESVPVRAALDAAQLVLAAILVTRDRGDRVSGLAPSKNNSR